MIRTLLLAIFVVCVFVAGCKHAEPQPETRAPAIAVVPSVAESREAQNQAVDGLFYCTAQYAADNASSGTTPTEIADASISHCNRQVRTLDNANQRWIVATEIATKSSISLERNDSLAKKILDDTVNSAHGIALERVIALRKHAAVARPPAAP
jgi:hypothetical protein